MRRAWLYLLAFVACDANGESLLDYYRHVQEQDPRLGVAAEESSMARSQRRQALAELLPHANAQAGISRTRNKNLSGPFTDPTITDGSRYTVEVEQSVLNLPQLKGYSAASAQVRQADYSAAAQQSAVRLDVIERYLAASLAAERAVLARQEEQTAAGQVVQVRALQERQLAKITDLLTAEARADLLRAARLHAEAEQAIALDLLTELSARPVSQLQSLAPGRQLPPLEFTIEESERSGATGNAQILALEQAAEQARLELEGRRWLRAPVLTFNATGLESDSGYDSLFRPKSRTGVISLNATLPLYAGGAISAAVGEARSRSRIANLELEAGRRNLTAETRSTFLQLQGLQAQVQATARAVASADRSVESAERGYSLGALTISELLDARRDSYVARRGSAEARYEYLRQWVRLARQTETLDEATLTRVSNLLDTPLAP